MSRDEENAILALKNAWKGAITSAKELEAHQAAVDGIAPDTALADVDLETFYRVSSAHALAVNALHGLIGELQRKVASES